jgi:hypothetical protein
MLSDQHYQVQSSHPVADAILAIEQKSFDAYVIDYKLPDGSGLCFTEFIVDLFQLDPLVVQLFNWSRVAMSS